MLWCTLLLIHIARISAFSCLNENGDPVDSWNAIKTPDDVSYYYYEARSESYELSPYTVNQTTEGAIMKTTGQLYSFPDSLPFFAYGVYNDEPCCGANSASSTYGHSKGVLLVNETQGFWLVHSMPKWPNGRNEGPAPFPDFTYGQSLMCVTINTETSEALANNLMIDRGYLYSENITSAAATALPTMSQWIDKQHSSADSNVSAFTSSAGASFYQFAKSKYWAKDLWDDLVAPYFHTSLNVETWRSGSGGRMSSMCGPNATMVRWWMMRT